MLKYGKNVLTMARILSLFKPRRNSNVEMDPLSLTASIITIAQGIHLALKAIEATRKARPELTILYNEATDLLVVLSEFKNALDSHQRGPSSSNTLTTAPDFCLPLML